MTRDEALKLANETVTAWITNPPTNVRGYADGWKPPTVAERTEAVIKLAGFLMVPEPPTRLVAPVGPATVYGWPVDGSAGPPSHQLYKIAKELIQMRARDGGIFEAREGEALASLIEAYERNAPQAGPA